MSETTNRGVFGDDCEQEVGEEPRTRWQLTDTLCPFCRRTFEIGDLIRVMPPCPADAVEAAKARRGLPYLSTGAYPLHFDCGDPKGERVETADSR